MCFITYLIYSLCHKHGFSGGTICVRPHDVCMLWSGALLSPGSLGHVSCDAWTTNVLHCRGMRHLSIPSSFCVALAASSFICSVPPQRASRDSAIARHTTLLMGMVQAKIFPANFAPLKYLSKKKGLSCPKYFLSSPFKHCLIWTSVHHKHICRMTFSSKTLNSPQTNT